MHWIDKNIISLFMVHCVVSDQEDAHSRDIMKMMEMMMTTIVIIFTGVSRWAVTGVRSSAVDTRGSVLTCVIYTVVRPCSASP